MTSLAGNPGDRTPRDRSRTRTATGQRRDGIEPATLCWEVRDAGKSPLRTYPVSDARKSAKRGRRSSNFITQSKALREIPSGSLRGRSIAGNSRLVTTLKSSRRQCRSAGTSGTLDSPDFKCFVLTYLPFSQSGRVLFYAPPRIDSAYSCFLHCYSNTSRIVC